MLDLPSEVLRTAVTTIVSILIAIGIEAIRKRSIGKGAFVGLTVGVVVGVMLAFFWPTGDPCLRAKFSAPLGTKNNAHAAAYEVDHEIPVSWASPRGEKCVMTVQTYQGADPKPKKEYKNVVSGTILEIGVSGSGETEIKIWVEGFNTPVDNTWVWIK